MSMKDYAGKIHLLTDTPFGYTLTMIGGKWRLVILYWLAEYESIRFNELKRRIVFLLRLLLFYFFRKEIALMNPLFSKGFGIDKKFVEYC